MDYDDPPKWIFYYLTHLQINSELSVEKFRQEQRLSRGSVIILLVTLECHVPLVSCNLLYNEPYAILVT